MLSPNAANRVVVIVGGAWTVTPNVHDAARCRASVAVQVTVVDPIAKSVWLAGVHETVTGGAPLVGVAAP
jgi:NADH dehydrogenase FAD-containing subunit